MLYCMLFVLGILSTEFLYGQKKEADSLAVVLTQKLTNDARVKAMRLQSYYMHIYNPDSALIIAYDALRLAKKIKFKEGISNTYEVLAIILMKVGNYNKALSYYIENLKIEESLNSMEGIASVRNNMGIVNMYMKDYQNALQSYKMADSIAYKHEIKDLYYSIKQNIGDVYEEMNLNDSAYIYYNQALNIAIQNSDEYSIGQSTLGLANIAAKQKNYELSLANYKTAMPILLQANDDDLYCEATLGMASVYNEIQNEDSALYYAHQSLYYAKKINFHSRELEASKFLSNFFSKSKKPDSAYFYLNKAITIKDSLLSIETIRVAEQLSFNEQIRQQEMAEKAIQEKEERRRQLQHIFIGIFIPLLFFATILLSRVRVKVWLIKLLGVISLLFLFEYLTLLLHPVVADFTHHTPIFEILIFVAIASLLIPLHHKIEHKMIELLVKRVSPQTPVLPQPIAEVPKVAVHKKSPHSHRKRARK